MILGTNLLLEHVMIVHGLDKIFAMSYMESCTLALPCVSLLSSYKIMLDHVKNFFQFERGCVVLHAVLANLVNFYKVTDSACSVRYGFYLSVICG